MQQGRCQRALEPPVSPSPLSLPNEMTHCTEVCVEPSFFSPGQHPPPHSPLSPPCCPLILKSLVMPLLETGFRPKKKSVLEILLLKIWAAHTYSKIFKYSPPSLSRSCTINCARGWEGEANLGGGALTCQRYYGYVPL